MQLDDPTARRGFHNAADAWPLRRLGAVAVLTPVLLALLVGAAGGPKPGDPRRP